MSQSKHSVIIKDQSGGYSKLALNDLLFAKSVGNYIQLYTDSNHLTTHGSLNSLETFLDSDPRFMRVHRSFLVNLEMVEHFSAEGLKLGEHLIPISNKCFDTLKGTFIAERLFKT